MPKISDKPLVRIHTVLFADDYMALSRQANDSQIPIARIIRTIIHSYVLHTANQARQTIDATERENPIEVQL